MEKDRKIQLADSLKRLMTERNLTVSSISRKTGINKSTIHNYCNGVVPRNLPQLKKLAELFEISLTDLIFNTEKVPNPKNKNQNLEGKYEVIIRKINF